MIDDLKSSFSISRICRVLGLCRGSLYYKPVENDETKTIALIKDEFELSRKTYGTRRLKFVIFKKYQVVLSRRKIGVMMKKEDMVTVYMCRKRKRRATHVIKADAQNLVLTFEGHRPNEVIAGDITYINLFNKWYYLCTLMDLCGRVVKSVSLSDKCDANNVERAFHNIKSDLRDIGIFHYDNGSEASNSRVDQLTAAFGIRRSYSRVGKPTDNAVVESWHKTLKTEFVNPGNFTCIDDFFVKLIDYVKWYNEERVMGSLNNLTPIEYQMYIIGKDKK